MGSVPVRITGSGRQLTQFFDRILYMVKRVRAKHVRVKLVILKKYTKAWLEQKTSDQNFAWEAETTHNGCVMPHT